MNSHGEQFGIVQYINSGNSSCFACSSAASNDPSKKRTSEYVITGDPNTVDAENVSTIETYTDINFMDLFQVVAYVPLYVIVQVGGTILASINHNSSSFLLNTTEVADES